MAEQSETENGDGAGVWGSAYPPSINAGIPKLGELPAGWSRLRMKDLLDVIERPVKLVDSKSYQLVTAKRSRGGIVSRGTLRGDEIKVKQQFEVRSGDFILSNRQIAHGGDPFESGSARPLDYGHWSAHKLEALTAHELRHGEAVAIGLALDTRYAVQVGMLAAGGEERVCALLERLGFDLWHPMLEARDATGQLLLLRGLQDFREHLGGELTITLLRDIGVGEEVHQMDGAEILRALAWLHGRERGA